MSLITSICVIGEFEVMYDEKYSCYETSSLVFHFLHLPYKKEGNIPHFVVDIFYSVQLMPLAPYLLTA